MKSKDNAWFWVVIVLYTLITLLRLINHQPWFDEAHAWSIAQELSLFDIFNLMAFEGHTFIWYLLLMPFAKTNFFYPWPMLIMNYLFAFVSVVLLWKKAPFSNITKTIITFSFPFLACLPILARCYSIGVMLLFLLAILYEKRLKNPLVYSTLIILCANTSVMAILGAAAFGFIFAYDLIREALKDNVSKKDFILSFVIMAFGAVLILWQLGNTSKLMAVDAVNFINNFTDFILSSNLIISTVAVGGFLLALGGIPFCIWSDKRALFFYLFVTGGLLAVFNFKYAGYAHHYIFLYIYCIVSLWIADINNKYEFITNTLIFVMFFGLLFNVKNVDIVYFASHSKDIAQIILQDKKLRDSRIIIFELFSRNLLPYLYGKNIDLWDYCSGEPANYSVIMSSNTPICTVKKKTYVMQYLDKVMTDEKDNYAVVSVQKSNSYDPVFIIQDKNKRVIFEFYKRIPKSGYLVYKLTRFNLFE